MSSAFLRCGIASSRRSNSSRSADRRSPAAGRRRCRRRAAHAGQARTGCSRRAWHRPPGRQSGGMARRRLYAPRVERDSVPRASRGAGLCGNGRGPDHRFPPRTTERLGSGSKIAILIGSGFGSPGPGPRGRPARGRAGGGGGDHRASRRKATDRSPGEGREKCGRAGNVRRRTPKIHGEGDVPIDPFAGGMPRDDGRRRLNAPTAVPGDRRTRRPASARTACSASAWAWISRRARSTGPRPRRPRAS